MPKKRVKRTTKKKAKKGAALNRKASSKAQIADSPLGGLQYNNGAWQTDSPVDFGPLGKLPVFIDADEDGPIDSQFAAIAKATKSAKAIRKKMTSKLCEEFEVAEFVDDDEVDALIGESEERIWEAATVVDAWAKEDGSVALSINVSWDAHTCVATVKDGKLISVIVP